jgi:hypothetical protein
LGRKLIAKFVHPANWHAVQLFLSFLQKLAIWVPFNCFSTKNWLDHDLTVWHYIFPGTDVMNE